MRIPPALGLPAVGLGIKSGRLPSAISAGFPMRSLLWLIDTVITLYIYVLIASAILSWLVAFNVVNTRNDVVRSIWRFLEAVTEPALRPIRRILPNLGGIDISPIILILGLMFLRNLLFEFLGALAIGS